MRDLLRELLENVTTASEADPSVGDVDPLLGDLLPQEGSRTSSPGVGVEGGALSAPGAATQPHVTSCCWADRFGDCYHCPMCGWCTP